MELETRELLRRLEQAEQEVRAARRGQRRIWIGAAALWIAGAFLAAARPAETALAIERSTGARRVRAPFVVVDRRGRPLLQVSDSPLGAGLTLFDRSGAVMAALGAGALGDHGGRGLVILDSNGQPIFLGGEGNTPQFAGRGMSVFDPKGQVVAALGTGSRNNNPIRGLAVVDEAGTPVAALGAGTFGADPGRGLGVIDPSGALVAGVFVGETGDRGRVALRDRNGALLFDAP